MPPTSASGRSSLPGSERSRRLSDRRRGKPLPALFRGVLRNEPREQLVELPLLGTRERRQIVPLALVEEFDRPLLRLQARRVASIAYARRSARLRRDRPPLSTKPEKPRTRGSASCAGRLTAFAATETAAPGARWATSSDFLTGQRGHTTTGGLHAPTSATRDTRRCVHVKQEESNDGRSPRQPCGADHALPSWPAAVSTRDKGPIRTATSIHDAAPGVSTLAQRSRR